MTATVDNKLLLGSFSENPKELEAASYLSPWPPSSWNSIITRQLAMIKIFRYLACIRNINIPVVPAGENGDDYMEMQKGTDRRSKEDLSSLIK